MLIIFDLDDTLIDTSGCITPHYLKKVLEFVEKKEYVSSAFDEFSKAFRSFNEKSYTTSRGIKEFFEIHDLPKKILDEVPFDTSQYKKFEYDLELTPHALEVVLELSKGHKLALVTNGVESLQYLKMKKASLDTSVFSRIIVSKNNKKSFYHEIMNELGYNSAQTLVCGDRISRDLTPAKELGMSTVQMRWGRGLCYTGNREDVDYSITNLRQIKPIIAQLDKQ